MRNKTRKVYYPPKYYRGLSAKKKTQRLEEIKKYGAMSWKNRKAYVGFKTNKGIVTRKSKYTDNWNKLFPNAKSLDDKSKATGVPLKYIDHVYRKGVGAWRTGHRPGAKAQQWGYARVHSFLLCGKTHYTADSANVRRAKKESSSAKKWFTRCPKSPKNKN